MFTENKRKMDCQEKLFLNLKTLIRHENLRNSFKKRQTKIDISKQNKVRTRQCLDFSKMKRSWEQVSEKSFKLRFDDSMSSNLKQLDYFDQKDAFTR